jgi:hypothetical protein
MPGSAFGLSARKSLRKCQKFVKELLIYCPSPWLWCSAWYSVEFAGRKSAVTRPWRQGGRSCLRRLPPQYQGISLDSNEF